MESEQLNNMDDIRIGKFRIWRLSGTDRIFIQIADDGEGGAFAEKAFEKHIQEFYDKHF